MCHQLVWALAALHHSDHQEAEHQAPLPCLVHFELLLLLPPLQHSDHQEAEHQAPLPCLVHLELPHLLQQLQFPHLLQTQAKVQTWLWCFHCRSIKFISRVNLWLEPCNAWKLLKHTHVICTLMKLPLRPTGTEQKAGFVYGQNPYTPLGLMAYATCPQGL